MASTSGGIVAHVSSASDMSETVSVTEKLVEDNKKSKMESIFPGSHWQLTFLHNLLAQSLQTMCVFFLL